MTGRWCIGRDIRHKHKAARFLQSQKESEYPQRIRQGWLRHHPPSPVVDAFFGKKYQRKKKQAVSTTEQHKLFPFVLVRLCFSGVFQLISVRGGGSLGFLAVDSSRMTQSLLGGRVGCYRSALVIRFRFKPYHLPPVVWRYA